MQWKWLVAAACCSVNAGALADTVQIWGGETRVIKVTQGGVDYYGPGADLQLAVWASGILPLESRVTETFVVPSIDGTITGAQLILGQFSAWPSPQHISVYDVVPPVPPDLYAPGAAQQLFLDAGSGVRYAYPDITDHLSPIVADLVIDLSSAIADIGAAEGDLFVVGLTIDAGGSRTSGGFNGARLVLTTSSQPPNVVPLPSAVWAGMGLMTLVGLFHRRRVA